MCAGRLVEVAPRKDLFKNPVHPYTKALLAAVPSPDLNHPLDFEKLMQGRDSNPAAWIHPFTATMHTPTELVALTSNHLVRAMSGTNPQELSP